MHCISVDTITDAYKQTLKQLLLPQKQESRLGTVREIINYAIKVHSPQYNLISCVERRFNYRYALAESLWNLCPRNDVDFLKAYSKGITKFVADQDQTEYAYWAYGPSVFPDLYLVVNDLSINSNTRRAVLSPSCGNLPRYRHPGTPPCTMTLQYQVRNGQLHATTYMRSNDAYLGMPYDMFTFTLWQQMIANYLAVDIGTYTHIAGSMHLYTKYESNTEDILPKLRTSYAIESTPMISDAFSIGLNNQLDDILEFQTFNHNIVPSLNPLLNVLNGDYKHADHGFMQPYNFSHEGIGW